MHTNTHEALHDVPQFLKDVNEYIRKCIDDDYEPISVVGLAAHLNTCKQTVHNWLNRYEEAEKGTDERAVFDAIKLALTKGEGQLLRKIYHHKGAAAGLLFIGKVKYGWVEEQHVQHTHTGGLSISVGTGVTGPLSVPTEYTG